MRLACLFLFVVSSIVAQPLIAQESPWKFSGRATITHDYYNLESDESLRRARRPQHLTRLIFTPTLSYKRFSLPVTVMLSSQGTNNITPPGQFGSAYALFNEIQSFEDLVNYLQNPINNVGIAPEIGDDLKLYAGTHLPQYSPLTVGNISIFGAGLEWTPKNLFIQANYGVSQHGIEADSASNIVGAYKRTQYSGRIGVGDQQKSFLALSVIGGRDDTNSISTRPIEITPQASFATALECRLQMGKHVAWGAEAAAGLFTEDLSARSIPQVENYFTAVPEFLQVNVSSRADGAVRSYLEVSSELWGVNVEGWYVGQGYKTFGYPFFQSDRLEWTINPRVSLLKRRLNISGSIGSRTNNLNDTRFDPMTQLLASANVNAQVSQKLNINASYSNFGIRSSVDNDTLRVEQVSQNVSLTPSLTFDNEATTNIYTVILTLDDFQDYNVVSGALNNNQSTVVGLTYNRMYKAFPLSVGLNLMRFQLNSTQIQVDNNTIGLTGGYRFFKNKLRTNMGITYLLNRPFEEATYDEQWLLSFRVNAQLAKTWSASAMVSNNAYDYGSSRQGARLSETTVRLSVTKRL